MAAAGAENSGFFETLLDSIVDAVIIIDAAGRIHRFNRSAQLMFGYAPGEVLQQNVSMLMPGMVMTGDVTVTPIAAGRFAIAGQYSMSGAWTLALEWTGPRGRGRTSIDLEVE